MHDRGGDIGPRPVCLHLTCMESNRFALLRSRSMKEVRFGRNLKQLDVPNTYHRGSWKDTSFSDIDVETLSRSLR